MSSVNPMRALLAAIVSLWLAGCATAKAVELPADAFVIDDVTIGETTFADIERKFGKSARFRTSTDDGEDEFLCYADLAQEPVSFVIFETGAMGGWDQVTGFRITKNKPKQCEVTARGLASKIGNGIKLGDGRADFARKFKGELRATSDGVFAYERESKRRATADELAYLRKTFPTSSATEFDVIVEAVATFSKGRLADYSLRRIESY